MAWIVFDKTQLSPAHGAVVPTSRLRIFRAVSQLGHRCVRWHVVKADKARGRKTGGVFQECSS
jgi:hypothetical protein